MTITFKDPNGVPCRLLVEPEEGDAYWATTADLLAALGQLSTGSDGPTDEELRPLVWADEWETLDSLPANALERVRFLEQWRFRFARHFIGVGAASRQAEVDRLTAENERLAREVERLHALIDGAFV